MSDIPEIEFEPSPNPEPAALAGSDHEQSTKLYLKVLSFLEAKTRILLLPELTLAVFVAISMLYKIALMRPEAVGRIGFAVLQHDAKLFVFMLVLYGLSHAFQHWVPGKGIAGVVSRVVAKIFLSAVIFLTILYAADVFIYHFFETRLYVSDIVTFSHELTGGFTLIRTGARMIFHHPSWKLIVIAGAAGLFLRSNFVLLAKGVSTTIPGRYIVATAIPIFVLPFMPVPTHFYAFDDKPLYENFIERNRDYFVREDFSPEFRKAVLSAPLNESCSTGQGRHVNVMIVLVESLSAYESQYFSGVEDWTPQLDRIARRETALTNFYANGWTTIGGMISLFTGTFPVVPEHAAYNAWGSPRFPDFGNPPNSIPVALEKDGYSTEFIGAGDLGFTDEGTWLKAIGFQKIIGGNDPRFSQQTIRGPFNSVPDRLLYNVALDELTKMPADKPYFLVVQTFWSHTPFMDENGHQLNGPEPVMRETDAQIGRLYDKLMETGFFKNGVLLITGDHRAPLPFQKAEFQRFGASATARIPAVIVTRAFPLPHVISQNFQQRDTAASIESLVSSRYCLGPEEGSFLSSPSTPPSCVLHSRGDDRDLIFVQCGSDEGLVRVAGDRTRFVEGKVPDEAKVIETINRARARP